MSSERPIVALDMGGTGLRVALVDAGGGIIDKVREPTRSEEGPERVVARIVESARGLLSKHGFAGSAGMGAAVASPQDDAGVLHHPPNLKGWGVVPLRAMLEEASGARVLMGNDANVAALGELLFGAGQGVDDLIYMTVSTGVGGGVVSGGRLITGARGLAVELGHIIIDRHAEAAFNCGHWGCLESLVSGTAIGQRARKALHDGEPSALRDLVSGGTANVGAKEVFEAAASGDAYANTLVDSVGHDLGRGLLSLIHVFNPRRLILGGGVALYNWPRLQPQVEEILRQALPGFLDDFEIKLSEFGDDVGLVGAAALIRQAGL